MGSPLRVLSLCSGIGGIDLAAEWAGFQIVGQIENNPFCQLILRQQFSGIPLLSDLKEVATYEKDELEEVFGRVDFLVGGIPCQPFSSAGKRRGTTDDRHLWPYAFTLIEKLQPAWILIENVRNFATMALDLVLSDLESLHYETQAFLFPACATGAPHIRERCFILAYHPGFRRGTWRPESTGQQGQSNVNGHGAQYVENAASSGLEKQQSSAGLHNEFDASGVGLANAYGNRQRIGPLQYERRGESTTAPNPGHDGKEGFMANPDRQSLAVGQCFTGNSGPQFQTSERVYDSSAGGGFATQPRMGGSTDGISDRLDAARWPAGPGPQEEWEPPRTVKGRQKWRRQRLEALGNAVNPYQVWPFMALIKHAEEEMENAA